MTALAVVMTLGADMPGELDGEARDAARAALDEDRLAGLQLQRVLDRADRGQAGEGECRGVDMRQAGRLLGDDGGADRDLLGISAVAAALEDAEHLVADLEIGNARAQR